MATAVPYKTMSEVNERSVTLRKVRGEREQRTDTATVEHQITRLAVSQTPKNRRSAEHSCSCNNVADGRRTPREHMVVSGCDPEVGVGDGCPPEGK
jgi:hypothetical protein